MSDEPKQGVPDEPDDTTTDERKSDVPDDERP